MNVEGRTETRRLVGLQERERPAGLVAGRLHRHAEPAEVDRAALARSQDKRLTGSLRHVRSSSHRCWDIGNRSSDIERPPRSLPFEPDAPNPASEIGGTPAT